MVTVRGPAESVESRLAAGALRCPCGGVLAPWGHARRRLVAVPEGWREFWPRRGRCRSCGRTHVLLPADLWSRRRYGAAVIMRCWCWRRRRPRRAGRQRGPGWRCRAGPAAGAGVDGQVVAGAVRRAGRGAAGAAGAAAAAGGPGGAGAGSCGVAGRGLPGRAGGGDRRAGPPVPAAGRGDGPRGGRAPVRRVLAGPGGAGSRVQHEPASRGRRRAFVRVPGGPWSGYPVMNRAPRGGMT